MSMTQEELNAILAGRVTLDDVLAGQQQSQDSGLPSAAQQYLSTFQDPTNYLGATADLYSQIPGYEDVKPGYKADDYLAGGKWMAGQEQAAGKAGWSTWLDSQKLGMAQSQDTREQGAYESKYSTPDADFLAATMKGLKPEDIQRALTSGQKDDVDFLMETIGAVDKNGMAEYSPANIQRLAHLEQYHENLQAQQAQEADTATYRQRWQTLTPEGRAKETYLRLTNPGQRVAVGFDGTAYYGEDAEKRASKAPKTYKAAPTPAAKPKPGPARSLTADVGNLISDVRTGKGPVGQAWKWSPEGVKQQAAKAVVEKTPDMARKAWHYAFG